MCEAALLLRPAQAGRAQPVRVPDLLGRDEILQQPTCPSTRLSRRLPNRLAQVATDPRQGPPNVLSQGPLVPHGRRHACTFPSAVSALDTGFFAKVSDQLCACSGRVLQPTPMEIESPELRVLLFGSSRGSGKILDASCMQPGFQMPKQPGMSRHLARVLSRSRFGTRGGSLTVVSGFL